MAQNASEKERELETGKRGWLQY